MELQTNKVYDGNTITRFLPKKVYDGNTRAGFESGTKYGENTSVGFLPKKVYGENTSVGFLPKKVYGENTSVGFEPDTEYGENTSVGFGPDKVYDENTSVGFAPDKDTGCPTGSAAEQPSWKENLSKRWSKKLPTKGDLCDSLLDTKLSLTVQSNSIIGLTQRIERLENDLADLIQYINERL